MYTADPTPQQKQEIRRIFKQIGLLAYMILLGRPTTIKELSDDLGINKETCSAYLHALQPQYVTRIAGKLWMVTAGGLSLIGKAENPAPKAEIPPFMAEIPPLGDSSSTSPSQVINKDIVVVVRDQNAEIPALKAENPASKAEIPTRAEHEESYPQGDGDNSVDNSETLEALYAAGINEPTASKLATLEWCTPEYVEAITADNQQRGKKGSGLIVFRIQQHDPMPKGCTSSNTAKDRARYAEWEQGE